MQRKPHNGLPSIERIYEDSPGDSGFTSSLVNPYDSSDKDPSKTSLRILCVLFQVLNVSVNRPYANSLVKELSAEGLQILGTNLGIHLGFWTWVTSKQASDSYWLNTHSKYETGYIQTY